MGIEERGHDYFLQCTDARPDSEFELLVDHDKLSTEKVPYPEPATVS